MLGQIGFVQNDEDLASVFYLFDDDRGGTICLENLVRISKVVGDDLSEGQLMHLLRGASDQNEDFVTLEEFNKLMRRGPRSVVPTRPPEPEERGVGMSIPEVPVFTDQTYRSATL